MRLWIFDVLHYIKQDRLLSKGLVLNSFKQNLNDSLHSAV